MNFGSDNQSGVSAQVLESLVAASSGDAGSYGSDEWTKRAEKALAETFDHDVRAFFVATGTAANCLALSALAKPWDAIVCHSQAHVAVDEVSAPELFSGGARLIPVDTDSGKITSSDLVDLLNRLPADRPHNVSVSALSVTQATETGLVYDPSELKQLTNAAHARGIRIHMDGARFSNAVASLGCTPADITWKAGVDVLCLGASKNGALAAEAVVFFEHALAEDFDMRRKRAGQLISKGRLFGSQFTAWLQHGHWLELARSANDTAQYLSAVLQKFDVIRPTWPVQANEIFVVMNRNLFSRLKSAGVRCSDWYRDSLPKAVTLGDDEILVRFVTSWSSTRSEVDELAGLLEAELK
ncbi:aminotransferase class I/II-fold pyridoxal phosphate-dependent enzyme [bacterium M00.F.Ca.ET.228.01.1.1]|uniref:threonine aldolase family protein n=1 Tax=Paraburkholderia phenoliruptrix TaxID=252970 RepID=UPI0010929278|nr:aminotransferase class I/II-fold pyridoxal phosphate-dependent enzyme [Paraburkholderia phenoliruptrix]TGP48051.1 aminotransferase class I/II-fold pyridoxal phosphate-dependent enzyme [bacterium M00.F.Ca.ET.228.01.1.1]TGS05843.1 aminotransferase class I/II-fold pyridoxal phosphate-dependent enzyme [bacterium M00.F.Ca.ET.191.01.1.1]TGU10780.1 aminotransferase class I/II-fold pyridoxal phosphate-dependent enzyme [bacterium M00.F.Ca.ET.155.01.1.1]MBW0445125.1 aminotransferase class I/II-fold py